MNTPSHQDLLAATIAGSSDEHPYASRGVTIYRRNRAAAAARALSVSYPTIALLLGDKLTALFAGEYLGEVGKHSADWGAWGDDFAAWLQQHPISREHPYLPDTARLDWAVHCCNRAADAQPDAETLQLLESHDDREIFAILAPGTALVSSRYPVLDIVAAHRENPAEPDLRTVRAKLERGVGQNTLVWRKGLLAQLREPLSGELPWLQQTLARRTLGEAFAGAGPTDMPLRDWLAIGFDTQLVTKLTINPEEL